MITEKSAYDNFVKNNKYLTKCQKKEFLNLKLNIFYVNNKSDKQIAIYISQSAKSKSIPTIMRIYILFNHFIRYDIVNKLIGKIKKHNYPDSEIYKYIRDHPEFHEKHKPIGPCSQYTYTFEKIALVLYSKYLNLESKSHIMYLDVACGNGHKTKLFAEKLELDMSNVFGTDIELWGPYQKDRTKLPIEFKLLQNNKLDFEDNEFNVLSIFLALHHLPPDIFDLLLKEFARVLKPGGILVVIEHNILNDYDHLIVDIEHSINAHIYDGNPDNTYANYFNYVELDFILKKYNFSWVYGYQMTANIGFDVRYDNPYYALYINNKISI